MAHGALRMGAALAGTACACVVGGRGRAPRRGGRRRRLTSAWRAPRLGRCAASPLTPSHPPPPTRRPARSAAPDAAPSPRPAAPAASGAPPLPAAGGKAEPGRSPEDEDVEELADKMLEPAWNKLKRELKKELPPDQVGGEGGRGEGRGGGGGKGRGGPACRGGGRHKGRRDEPSAPHPHPTPPPPLTTQAKLVDSMSLSDVLDGDSLMRSVAESQLGPLLESMGSSEDPFEFFKGGRATDGG
jgi:hypothetical protein